MYIYDIVCVYISKPVKNHIKISQNLWKISENILGQRRR